MGNRAVLYLRLSKEDADKVNKGDDSSSIKSQRLMHIDILTKKSGAFDPDFITISYIPIFLTVNNNKYNRHHKSKRFGSSNSNPYTVNSDNNWKQQYHNYLE